MRLEARRNWDAFDPSGDKLFWTHLARHVVMILGVACLIVVYNLAPHWTSRINWLPKTQTGQIAWTIVLLGTVVVYVICVD
jgi:uncharacterized membrane protein